MASVHGKRLPAMNNCGGSQTVAWEPLYSGFQISVWQSRTRTRSSRLYWLSPRLLPEGELTGGGIVPYRSYSIAPPPILPFPHQGGRDLYLPL